MFSSRCERGVSSSLAGTTIFMKPKWISESIKCFKERFISLENFIHGGWNENPNYHNRKFIMERAKYARENPWVLNYDFGHKECLEFEKKYKKYFNGSII